MAESRARFKTDDEYNYPAWKSVNMSDVCEFVRNGFNYNSDGIRTHKNKITRIETISSGTINLEKLGSTDDDIPDRYLMKDGDILFSHINSLPYLGNAALFNSRFGKIYHGMNLLCIRPNTKKILPYYLFLYLQTSKIRNWVLQNAKRAVNQCSIPASEIENMPVIVPCIEEQQKISKFLLTVDEITTASEKEVANLEAQKKAVMKKIFSQEVRFKRTDGSDFPEWKAIQISDMLTICHGKDYKHLGTGDIPVMGTGGVITYVNKSLCDWECVCIGRKGTIDRPYYMDKPFWSVDTLFYSKPKEGFLPKYQFYIFQNINWKLYNEATGVPSLSASTIEKIGIRVACLEEQRLIADFLSDFDEAIAAAKKELELWKELKKGLLQQMFV